MIELIFIVLQIIFITFLFIFSPYNSLINLNSIYKSIFEKIAINLIFSLNFLLLISCFNISINLAFVFLCILSLLSILTYLIKKNYSFNEKLPLTIFLIIVLIISINLFDKLYFGWDVKSFWYLKTVNFYSGFGVDSLKNTPVYDYPHLGVYIWSLFWKFPLNISEVYGRVFYVFIYMSSIFLFFQNLKIDFIKKLIFITSLLLLNYEYEYFSGLQEILIFSFILMASKFCLDIFEEKKELNQLKIIIILLAITNVVCWIKNEGLFLMLLMNGALFLTLKTTLKNKITLVTGSLIIILIRLFYLMQNDIGLISYEVELSFLNNVNVPNLYNDFITVIFYIFVYLSQIPTYLICLPLIVYLLFTNKSKNKVNKFLLIYGLFNLIFIILAFVFAMDYVEWQAKVGMKRVLFQTSGFYLLTIFLVFNKITNKKNDKRN